MDKTNLFFLAVAGGVAWWMFNEYQKQRQAQTVMFAAQNGVPEIAPIDYEAAQATRFRTGFEYPLSYPRTGIM